jgi:hypothetical protein
VIAICAVICSPDSCVDIELFGKFKLAWQKTLLNLPNRIIVAGYLWAGACGDQSGRIPA